MFQYLHTSLFPKAHSSVERAALIGGVMMRKVPTDNKYAVRGEMLKRLVEEDKAAGLIPFYVRKYKTIYLTIKHLNIFFSIELHVLLDCLCCPYTYNQLHNRPLS